MSAALFGFGIGLTGIAAVSMHRGNTLVALLAALAAGFLLGRSYG